MLYAKSMPFIGDDCSAFDHMHWSVNSVRNRINAGHYFRLKQSKWSKFLSHKNFVEFLVIQNSTTIITSAWIALRHSIGLDWTGLHWMGHLAIFCASHLPCPLLDNGKTALDRYIFLSAECARARTHARWIRILIVVRIDSAKW